MKNGRYSQSSALLVSTLKKNNVKQGQVAAWCHVSQPAVYKWLHAKACPHPCHIALLAMHLELDLEEFALATGYELEAILQFLPYNMALPDESPYGEKLLRQLSEAVSQGDKALAFQKVREFSSWLELAPLSCKAPVGNLPPSKAKLMKQHEAVARVLKELGSRWPIVAIEGMPGSGKSTLASQVARRCLDRDPRVRHIPFQAVVWISAKDQSEPKQWLNEVIDTIAWVLGYPSIRDLSPQQKRIEGLKLLRSRLVLLIIDNYETMQDPELEAWLEAIPEPSKVLVTSLPDQLRMARRVVLQGLSETRGMAFLKQCVHTLQLDAVHSTSGESAQALVSVSAGNPKVIEIALGAVKYEQLSLTEIVTRLQSARDPMEQLERLLATDWKNLSGVTGRRGKSMQGADLHAIQRVLVVMPFFVESVSKEALAAVASVAEEHLDRLLTQLIEMGLIDAYRFPQSEEPRFNIHPVVRAFANKKLAEMPAFETQARADWYSYFLAYVEHYGDDDHGECIGYGREGHREKLTAELSNLRAAIEWCFRHQPEQAVRLVERITTYLLDEGFFSERLDLSQRAYDIAKLLQMWKSEVGLLVRKGWTELVMGEWETAEKTYQQAIALAQKYNVTDRLVQALRDLGHLFALRGALVRESNISEAEAWFAKAEQLIAESLAWAQATSDTLGILEAHTFAARVAYLRGDVAHRQEAKRMLDALLTECEAVRQWRHLLFIHRYLAQIALKERDVVKAQQHVDFANETLQKRYYEAHEEAQNMECQGDIEAACKDQDQARTTYQKALDLTLRLGMKQEQMRIRLKLQKLATSH